MLSAIEWQAGALAQIAEIGVHPARHTVDKGRRFASDSNLRGSLKPGGVTRRNRIRDAPEHAGGMAEGNRRRAGSKAGAGPATTTDPS